MAVVMAVKEDTEIKTIQKACQVTCDVFSKYLKEQIMEVIDNDKVTNSPVIKSPTGINKTWSYY